VFVATDSTHARGLALQRRRSYRWVNISISLKTRSSSSVSSELLSRIPRKNHESSFHLHPCRLGADDGLSKGARAVRDADDEGKATLRIVPSRRRGRGWEKNIKKSLQTILD
jgi:hypothetical protein